MLGSVEHVPQMSSQLDTVVHDFLCTRNTPRGKDKKHLEQDGQDNSFQCKYYQASKGNNFIGSCKI